MLEEDSWLEVSRRAPRIPLLRRRISLQDGGVVSQLGFKSSGNDEEVASLLGDVNYMLWIRVRDFMAQTDMTHSSQAPVFVQRDMTL